MTTLFVAAARFCADYSLTMSFNGAWKAAHFEKEPIIEASMLQKILEVTPLDKVIFAAAGGARYKGAELRGVIMRNHVLTPEEIKKESEHGVPSASFGLRAFIEAPCVIIKENLISRRILIKYVSNKLGGAHHDSRRGKTKEELLFSLLDGTQQYRLLDKPAVYFELLSAGQAIARSSDVVRLIAKAHPNAKPNNSTPNNGLQNNLSQGVGS
jgi:hypothetical protein